MRTTGTSTPNATGKKISSIGMKVLRLRVTREREFRQS